MTRPRILHLVDDATAGGVMRVLDYLVTSPELAEQADHTLRHVPRGGLRLGRLDADMIVSHLAVSWRSLPMLALLRLRNPHARLVHVEHSYTEGFVNQCVRRKGRFAFLLRTAYRLFDRVVAVSRAQGKWLIRSGAVTPGRLAIIPSCVDLSAFRALPRRSGPIRTFGAIGRLDPQKGFDTLIAAFRTIPEPNLSLHIYGEGPEEARLRSLAAGDGRIVFKGRAVNPCDAFAAVDAVAMPSRWEAYGLVAIEARAAGRALLVQGVDGLTDHLPLGAHVAEERTSSAWANLMQAVAAGTAQPPVSEPTSVFRLEERFLSEWNRLISEFRL
ncbi:glycosyltransferase [Oceanicola sp. D3]|uniref:glycosyltransferase n=1 Tax=Oceanicola sp. D3 TaxID=2587163 RepID=UPI001121D6B8|nr:glycosyltransferase [Oceanicola sp. D3]QDC10066.1 glycosyltransferase [Oceanicola sp. D3]